MIVFTDGADEDEVADSFYNLNNGMCINAATKNRVKAKSRKQISRLGKHELFSAALSKVAIDGHVNDSTDKTQLWEISKLHGILIDDGYDVLWLDENEDSN